MFFDCLPTRASWCGDFELGNFLQWDGYNGVPNGPTATTVNTGRYFALTPSGRSDPTEVFKATVDEGAVTPGQAGQRTMLTLFPNSDPKAAKTKAYEGADEWYRTRLYFPADFRPSPSTSWNWVVEWHNWPDGPCCANLSLGVLTNMEDGGPLGGERLSLRVLGGGDSAHPMTSGMNAADDPTPAGFAKRWFRGPSIQRSLWYDVLVHVRWDYTSAGRVDWWLDGRQLARYDGPTLYYYADNNPDDTRSTPGPGQAYLAEGYYRPSILPSGATDTSSATVYHDGARIGPTLASVS